MHSTNRYEEYTRSYETRYVAEIQHLGLGTFRVLKDLNSHILKIKIGDQYRKWDAQYAKTLENHKNQSEKIASVTSAKERTSEAIKLQQEIDNILLFTLGIDDRIDWENLKNKKRFKIPNPKNQLNHELNKLIIPRKPKYKKAPIEPLKTEFQPSLTLLDKIFKSRAEKKIQQANNQFELARANWEKEKNEIEQFNKMIEQQDQEAILTLKNQSDEIRKKFDLLEIEWKESEIVFYKEQELANLEVEKLKSLYLEHNPQSVINYCELVLNNSVYPDFIAKDFDLEYIKDSKLLLIEFVLPAPDDLPTLTEVRYVATTKELKEHHLSETQKAKKYDTLVYNIALRTLHEIFEADQANAIEIVVFNGWVRATNKATGKVENSCIVSIQVKKDEFLEINLSQIDPKACFKNLKGIGSSKLSGITAIQPVLNINKSDKRFVASYDVTSTLDSRSNIAAMNWEDFEHLIREVFEKEFSSNGGEVKVTQASRDGGVDAIAFDPDPIRGGKIVIQAKRYTNTVGVSAVRDLYGTVVNEGATKGILVTTADFGPDAYEFAKSKPLTLLNGANLLYLLEKYGHNSKIDLVEAKRMQKENL